MMAASVAIAFFVGVPFVAAAFVAVGIACVAAVVIVVLVTVCFISNAAVVVAVACSY